MCEKKHELMIIAITQTLLDYVFQGLNKMYLKGGAKNIMKWYMLIWSILISQDLPHPYLDSHSLENTCT
jgi:TM2 domain-containing membrane protein YozV